MSTAKSTLDNGVSTTPLDKHPPALKRRLKVKRGFYDYQASQPPQERSTIAEITLKGKWLAEAGFTVGSQVTVHTTNGWMLIVVDE